MRLYSSTQSREDGETTLLSLAEFAITTGIAAWIIYDGWLILWLAIASLTMPLFTLQTARSRKIGVDALHWWSERIRLHAERSITSGVFNDREYSLASMMLMYSPVVAVLIRFGATTAGAVTQPFTAIAAIPQNWFRQVFCTDSMSPAELVPGVRESGRYFVPPLVENPFDFPRENGITSWRAVIFAWLVIRASIMYGPTIVFRTTFKITALVWIGLLWCVSPLRDTEDSGEERLEDLTTGLAVGLGLVWSLIVAGAGLWKLHLAASTNWATQGIWGQRLVVETPLWQLAALCGAAVSWILFLWANSQIKERRRGRGATDATVLHISISAVVIKRLLGAYVTVNSVELLLFEARLLNHLKISWQIFSWS